MISRSIVHTLQPTQSNSDYSTIPHSESNNTTVAIQEAQYTHTYYNQLIQLVVVVDLLTTTTTTLRIQTTQVLRYQEAQYAQYATTKPIPTSYLAQMTRGLRCDEMRERERVEHA